MNLIASWEDMIGISLLHSILAFQQWTMFWVHAIGVVTKRRAVMRGLKTYTCHQCCTLGSQWKESLKAKITRTDELKTLPTDLTYQNQCFLALYTYIPSTTVPTSHQYTALQCIHISTRSLHAFSSLSRSHHKLFTVYTIIHSHTHSHPSSSVEFHYS